MDALYVSFHGGKHDYNNLHVYDLSGGRLGKAIDKDTLPSGMKLKELRGFTIGPDGKLYVANAQQDLSNIARFTRSGDHTWVYDTVFAQGHTPQDRGLFHPYDIEFGPDGNLYVSSQDSGLVTRFAGPDQPQPGLALPTVLPGFPPGTFASLQDGDDYQPGQGAYPIRGIAFDGGGSLHVANETTDEIEAYDGDGQQQPGITSTSAVTIDKPVQVLFDAHGVLYIGSAGNDAVVTYANGTLSNLIGPDGKHLHALSGLALDADGHLYVGSRKADKILRYELPDTTPSVLLHGLADNPEFVRVLPGS